METAMADGTREVVPGTYTLWACDYHPFDTNARSVVGDSACIQTTVSL
jgi:hypothetical protein